MSVIYVSLVYCSSKSFIDSVILYFNMASVYIYFFINWLYVTASGFNRFITELSSFEGEKRSATVMSATKWSGHFRLAPFSRHLWSSIYITMRIPTVYTVYTLCIYGIYTMYIILYIHTHTLY